MLQAGRLVRVNLAGLQAEGVMFQAAVTDAVGRLRRKHPGTAGQTGCVCRGVSKPS